jgi:beta-lactamase regulating signal transducer with metallopeptidase domain
VFLLRKKSAAVRHFILSFSLISLLVIPFFSTFTDGWKTRWLPSWQTRMNSSLNLDHVNKNKAPTFKLDQNDKAHHANNIQHSQEAEDLPRYEKAVIFNGRDVEIIAGLSLTIIWTAGLIFLLFKIILGLYGAHRLTRQGKRISGSFWQLLLKRFLDAVSIRRTISLLSHETVRVPLTWGVIKPVVIMPADSRNWNTDQCSSALFHELSHVKRSDFLVKILARFSCSLYWFNPLSWFVFRLMKKDQEKACDELVIKAGVKPSTYAANLLSIQKAGQVQWNPPVAVLGATGKSQLNERLLAILKQRLKPKEVKMRTKIILSFFIIAAAVFIGLARPSQSVASTETVVSSKDTTLAETQNPPRAEGVQEEQEEKETKKAEKEKSADEKEKKKKVKWVSKDDKPAKISIWIDKDEKAKKIIVTGKPFVFVKKGSSEKGLVLNISGKDLELIEGEEGCWTLKADKVHIINEDEAKVIKLDEDKVFGITIEKRKDGKTIHILQSPEVHIKKAIKIPSCYSIGVKIDKGKEKAFYIDPHLDIVTLPHLDVHPVIHLKSEHKELKEKLEKLRERLKKIREIEDEVEKDKAQEEALEDIEKALEELSKELEDKSEKIKDLNLAINMDLKHKLKGKLKLAKKIKTYHPSIDIEGDKKIIGFVDKDGRFKLIIKSKLDSEKRGEYEEKLKQLKESLPEGYNAESEIDEEDNTITIKITCEKRDDKSWEEVKKLVKEFVDKLSKKEKKSSNA